MNSQNMSACVFIFRVVYFKVENEIRYIAYIWDFMVFWVFVAYGL